VDRHQQVVKHGEIDVASLLFLSQSLLTSLQVLNVSKHDDIQSIKQYEDHQQNEMKQYIGGLEKSIRKVLLVVPEVLNSNLDNTAKQNDCCCGSLCEGKLLLTSELLISPTTRRFTYSDLRLVAKAAFSDLRSVAKNL
jgi:hypothetical protein